MTAIRGGLDMRGTASFLSRFWKNNSGASAPEVAIMIAFAAVIVANIVIKANS